MPTPAQIAMLEPTGRRGSRLRCVMLTDGDRASVARRISALIDHQATVDPARHVWLPNGFALPQEAKLGETAGFISHHLREALMKWWLMDRRCANLPNWDIVSGATIDGREGLILVEAKAYDGEARTDGKSRGGNANNDKHIRDAIALANAGLNGVVRGWNLTAESHYQLCNRFAWAWKLASLKVPVVLVYLGFLNAKEMKDCGQPFVTRVDWQNALHSHCKGIVPEAAWKQQLEINRISMRALIGSTQLDYEP